MLAAMAKNNPQKPFTEVAEKTGLAPELLRKLVRDGVLVGEAPYGVASVIGTCDIEQACKIAAQLEAARHKVEGVKIPVPEAIEKYGFSKNGVYSWIRAGWIRKSGAGAKGDMLIDEGDIAFARALADITKHRKAKALFPTQKNKR